MSFSKAPLPFIGQKRKFRAEVKDALSQMVNPGDTIIDVFGGSGLLARWAKDWFPDCRVIWNDYDNYRERLSRVTETQALLNKIAAAVPDTIPYKGAIRGGGSR